MEIINYLENSQIIDEFEVEEFRIFKTGFFIKIKANIKDGSELFIKEYSDEKERNYSYYWQNSNGSIIARWDNSPHHENIATYPHHVHRGRRILTSFDIAIEEIITSISNIIAKC